MNLKNPTLLAILCLTFLFACKKEAPKGPLVPVVLETKTLQKMEGADCAKADTLRSDCLEINLSWPEVKDGNEALKKGVAGWANYFLTGLISPFADDKDPTPASVEEAIKELVKSHQDFIKDAEGSPMGNWAAESNGNVLLNDGKYLTLEIEAFTYFGGAHGNPLAAVATFDTQTGKRLTWDNLVTEKEALKTLAEKAFRSERKDLFQPAPGDEPYKFDESFHFELPQNYGLTDEGIYCHYLHYEVGPYAIGNTQFTIPFKELGTLLKVQPPSPQSGKVEEEVLDIYEVEGDSLVIPTFEIEVGQSQKARQLLAKQKETTIVSASFSGEPKSDQDKDDVGMMFIADKEIELTDNNRIARFEGLTFSKKAYKKLADKDIGLIINVYSGRKSSEDNLLDCGLLDLKASQFMGKRFVLRCQLTAENPKGDTSMVIPYACYALPPAGAQPDQQLALLVTCSERGEIEWAGQPMKDYDALMAAIRPVLVEMKKNGAKELPALETQGCLMGNSGEIRTRYDELKAELLGEASTSTSEYNKVEEPKKPKTATTSSTKTSAKTAAPKSSPTTVTLNQKGEITLAGKKVTMENLRKELQAALLTQMAIPDKLELKTIGETGMGMRGEVNTIISESIAGAKWVRKKAAIAALNEPVGKKLSTATQLEINTYQSNGTFAYISARPKQVDGKAIDYSKTSYSKDAQSKSFSDNVIGLLKYENGKWQVLTYSIGVGKPPVDAWVKTYKVPKALLGA